MASMDLRNPGEKTVDTVLGAVRLRRAYYHCADCGHGRFPKDEDLGVIGSSLSPGLRRMVDRVGSQEPFAHGSVVAMLVDTEVSSLRERPLEEWLGAVSAGSETSKASAVGFLRYAYRHLEDLASGGGAEAQYARDDWDASHLGVSAPGTVGHHRVSFGRIPRPWLRQAVKLWCQGRLTGGISFGAIRRDTAAMSWFATYLD